MTEMKKLLLSLVVEVVLLLGIICLSYLNSEIRLLTIAVVAIVRLVWRDESWNRSFCHYCCCCSMSQEVPIRNDRCQSVRTTAISWKFYCCPNNCVHFTSFFLIFFFCVFIFNLILKCHLKFVVFEKIKKKKRLKGGKGGIQLKKN